MKLYHRFILAVIIATLSPTIAYADHNSEAAANYLPPATTEANSLDVINLALRNEPDQVLASFERDLTHMPAAAEESLRINEADPLDVIYAILRGENPAVHALDITDRHPSNGRAAEMKTRFPGNIYPFGRTI